MAAAGYFYNSENDTDDVATCYMCRKSLDFWEEQDNPWIQHCSHSPECPLVNLDKFENRVATFIAWPHKDFDADCNAFAKAGFYYYPSKAGDDTVNCFQCDVSLDSWEKHDNPRNEHERRNPLCPYLVTGKVVGYPAYECSFGSIPLDRAMTKLEEKSDFTFSYPDEAKENSSKKTNAIENQKSIKKDIFSDSENEKPEVRKSLLNKSALLDSRLQPAFINKQAEEEKRLVSEKAEKQKRISEEKAEKEAELLKEKTRMRKQEILETMESAKSRKRIAHEPTSAARKRSQVPIHSLESSSLVKKGESVFTVSDYIEQLRREAVQMIEEKYSSEMSQFETKMKKARQQLEENLKGMF